MWHDGFYGTRGSEEGGYESEATGMWNKESRCSSACPPTYLLCSACDVCSACPACCARGCVKAGVHFTSPSGSTGLGHPMWCNFQSSASTDTATENLNPNANACSEQLASDHKIRRSAQK